MPRGDMRLIDRTSACSWADIDYRYGYFQYHGSKKDLFCPYEMKQLAEGAQRIKDGFNQEVRSGPFNHSYIFLDAQLGVFIDSWTSTLKWHQEKLPERREAHDRYVALQAHRKQQEQEMTAARVAADERRRKRDKQCLEHEQVRLEAHVRTLLSLERDMTGLSRVSSMTSHYNLQ